MEQRIYYGNIDPNTLANYLVGIFHQSSASPHYGPWSMAQKVKQGTQVYVQIMRAGNWSGSEHGTLSVQILKIAGGVNVSMGSSDWLDLDQAGLAGTLLGALFFPPLLLFPMIHSLAHSSLSQDVWNAIDAYCLQAPARPAQRGAPQGFYCSYCGALNHPTATSCHACHAPFAVTPPQPEPPPQPAPEEPARAGVVCPFCGARVADAKFCGNCAAPLHGEPVP